MAPIPRRHLAIITADNLNYGYALRNLTALQVLDAIWRQSWYG